MYVKNGTSKFSAERVIFKNSTGIANLSRQIISLCSKRFRLVLEQRKTEERDYRFWPREKWIEPKNERGFIKSVRSSHAMCETAKSPKCFRKKARKLGQGKNDAWCCCPVGITHGQKNELPISAKTTKNNHLLVIWKYCLWQQLCIIFSVQSMNYVWRHSVNLRKV